MNSILVILSKLFFGSTTSHQRFEDNRSLELIKSVIRKEVFYMSLRILIGIVLTVMVTFHSFKPPELPGYRFPLRK